MNELKESVEETIKFLVYALFLVFCLALFCVSIVAPILIASEFGMVLGIFSAILEVFAINLITKLIY